MTPRESSRGVTRRYPRTARIDRVVQQVVADAIERSNDDRLSLVTVTGVKVDPDLRHAVVFYATRGVDPAATQEGLDEERAVIQKAIGQQVRMKRTPLLHFEPDPALEAGWKIEAILKRIEHSTQDESDA